MPGQMVAGAAGALGHPAEQELRKEGESAITLHPRMEAPPVQGGVCKLRPVECLWTKTMTDVAVVTTWTDHWATTSFSSEECKSTWVLSSSCQLPDLIYNLQTHTLPTELSHPNAGY